MTALAIALAAVIGHNTFTYGGGVALTFFVSLFIAASTVGPGVAGWTYTGESGFARLHAKTTTLGTVDPALVGLVMTSVLPHMLNAKDAGGTGWGAEAGFMFFILGCLSIVGVWFMIPEHADRAYAELDELFARKVPARKCQSTDTTEEYGRELTNCRIFVMSLTPLMEMMLTEIATTFL